MKDKNGIYLALALATVAIGISVGTGVYYSDDDSVNELSASLSNRLNMHETHIEDVKESIEIQESRIDTERLNNIEMAKIILKLEESDTNQRVAIAILEARGDRTTQPSGTTPPVDTIQLSLKHSDNKGNTKSGYPRDVPAILIQGESSFLKKTFGITIKDPNGAFVKDKFASTLSDGDISEAWIPINNPVAGTYTVTISIDGKTDSIQFILL
jgi:hypothetical protein